MGYVKEFRKLARETNRWLAENRVNGVSAHPPTGWAENFEIEEDNKGDIEWLWRHVWAELINVTGKED